MSDNVNHPAHYTGFSNGSEVIDITEHLSFNLGNTVKYCARAGKKDSTKHIEDLQKARFYLDREIGRLTKTTNEHGTVNVDSSANPATHIYVKQSDNDWQLLGSSDNA